MAIVSEIVGSTEPLVVSKYLRSLITSFQHARQSFSLDNAYTVDRIKSQIGEALSAIKELSPLVHQVRICLSLILQLTKVVAYKHGREHTVGQCDPGIGSFSHYGDFS